ncbi:MAG TPA: hypothetical protein VGC97_03050 [Pyrinomonadaceae bacterium]|jgi:hypothetical protein
MDDKTFAIIIALISSTSAILVAYITSLFVERRESRSFSRQNKKDKLEKYKFLYENVLFSLSNVVVKTGVGTIEEQIEFTRLESQLDFYSTREIREQFNKAFELAQDMSAYYRSAEPKKLSGGYILIESEQSSYAKEYKAKADEILPNYHKNFFTLRDLMLEHLEKLEKENN